jgi:hypothetical protein
LWRAGAQSLRERELLNLLDSYPLSLHYATLHTPLSSHPHKHLPNHQCKHLPHPFHSNYADKGCQYSRPLGNDPAGDYSEPESDLEDGGVRHAGGSGADGAGGVVWNVRQLGRHPETGEQLVVKKGPYGLYVQAVSVEICV